MEKVTSKDGTSIAYERMGSGPPLILVDGALCSRRFGPMPRLAPLLAKHFTVFMYDRRGRGDSGDTAPYSKQRELEDIEALLQVAGGSAYLVGLSSGASLALQATASGLPVKGVFAYEPPYMVDDNRHAAADHEKQLKQFVAQNRRGDAVTYFMRDMVGAPGFVVVMMKLMPWIWSKLKAVAHTLPYDAAVMDNFATVPSALFSKISTRTMVCHGGKTDARLKSAANAVAAAIPGAQHSILDGQNHNVNAAVLAPAVASFFGN